MTGEPCKYCGQEERYGHNALCVMNTVDELRAEVERLKAALHALVSRHNYKHLDLGIGTALPDGRAWLGARRLVEEPKP